MSNSQLRISKPGYVILTALGVLSLSAGIYIGSRQVRMYNWPQCKATILEYDLNSRPQENGCHGYANLKTKYRYRVDQQWFESSRLYPSPFNFQFKQSYFMDTATFRPGATVPCWYNPNDPGQAYIVKKGLTPAPVVLALVGLLNCLPLLLLAVRRGKVKHADKPET